MSERQVEASRLANTIHGMTGTSTHNLWMGMIDRCTNPNAPRYADYGGRGIAVCERWRDFCSFLQDMGKRPEGLSLDRIDNNSGYCPENCRWATRVQQANNARTNKRITCLGRTLTEAQWSRDRDIKRPTLQYRLNAGWSIEQALGFADRSEARRYRCKSSR